MVSPRLVIYGVRCTLGRFSLEHFYRANSRLHSRVHPLRGMSGRGKKMSLWGVIYFFSKRNVSHVAIPTYFFPVSKRVAKKFMLEKIREINGTALRKGRGMCKQAPKHFGSLPWSYVSGSYLAFGIAYPARTRSSYSENRTRTVFGVEEPFPCLCFVLLLFVLRNDRRMTQSFDLLSPFYRLASLRMSLKHPSEENDVNGALKWSGKVLLFKSFSDFHFSFLHRVISWIVLGNV